MWLLVFAPSPRSLHCLPCYYADTSIVSRQAASHNSILDFSLQPPATDAVRTPRRGSHPTICQPYNVARSFGDNGSPSTTCALARLASRVPLVSWPASWTPSSLNCLPFHRNRCRCRRKLVPCFPSGGWGQRLWRPHLGLGCSKARIASWGRDWFVKSFPIL